MRKILVKDYYLERFKKNMVFVNRPENDCLIIRCKDEKMLDVIEDFAMSWNDDEDYYDM